jgi:hypothetical protein
MSRTKQSVDMQLQAQRRRALASEYDPIRRDFELGLAQRMQEEARELLTPAQPLQIGLGGEIIPCAQDDLPGLESTLREPDLLSAQASQQRAELLERAGVLELGIEAAQQLQAGNSIEQMLTHQMAAAHRRAMTLLAESEQTKDAQVACLKIKTATRMMNAFAQGAITLRRLQLGVTPHQIQQVHVAGNAVVGQITGQ